MLNALTKQEIIVSFEMVNPHWISRSDESDGSVSQKNYLQRWISLTGAVCYNMDSVRRITWQDGSVTR